jgi:hypothetical protein
MIRKYSDGKDNHSAHRIEIEIKTGKSKCSTS